MPGKILIIGHPGESVIRHVVSIAQRHAVPYDFLDLSEFHDAGALHFSSEEPGETWLDCGGRRFNLIEYSGIYQRTVVPSRFHMEYDRWFRIQSQYVALKAIFLSFAGRIVNRPLSGWENLSKPLQTLWLSQHGFRTPASLSTSRAVDYQSFRGHQEAETIYKSNSGIRSIVDRVEAVELDRLSYLENCPVFFQKRIVGKDIRLHVLDDMIFAVEIESDAVDYRYANSKGTYRHMRRLEDVPVEVTNLCCSYSRKRRVALAGFDFKVDSAGDWYCLEMNPTPSFESYDHVLGGIIARQLLDYLSYV